MGKVHRKISKIHPLAKIDKGLFDDLHPMGTSAEMQLEQLEAAEDALESIKEEEAIPMPDEEAVERERRRRASSRRRVQTTYSTDQGFGG